VVTAVWGAEFIELFLDVCVPNQLSQGNLPALPPGSRYRIFTGSADHAMLAASPKLDDLRRVLPVDIVEVDLTELDPQANPNTYKMMTACHRRAVADAAAGKRALIFLAPDFVLAEGTIAGLVRIHSGGARAVLTANLRLSRESFLAAWAEHRDVRALAPRQLVRLGMRHLHRATESFMVDGPSTNDFPTSVYWPVRSSSGIDGLLIRAFHLHPMLVDPVHRMELPRTTIDGHYLTQSCPDLNRCVVVNDSDELVAFELTPSNRTVGSHDRSRGVSLLRLAAVAAKCDPYQRAHWQRPIRLHAGELDKRWAAVEAQSAVFVRKFERYRPLGPLLTRMYRLLKTWRRRRAGYARTMRRALRRDARAVIRAVRRPLRRREAYARAVSKALQPQRSAKRIARSAKLLYHRVAKAGRLGLKRARRRVRLFRPA
jgi:hypothetical protein